MIEKYEIHLYQQSDGYWVAFIPAIEGCHAIMPTRNEALDELDNVLSMISQEYQEQNKKLPKEKTYISYVK